MSTVSELIRSEADGSLSFGEHAGDVYKVKTFKEITKLEKGGVFAYESVPGTAVTGLRAVDGGVSFNVEGPEDAEITIGLAEETSYDVKIGGTDAGTMTTGLGGKLTISVELGAEPVAVEIKRA